MTRPLTRRVLTPATRGPLPDYESRPLYDPSANAEVLTRATDSCSKGGPLPDVDLRPPRMTRPLTRRVLTRAAVFRCVSRLCDNVQYRPTGLKSADSDLSATRVSTIRVSVRVSDGRTTMGFTRKASQFLMGLLAELLVRTYHESQYNAIYAVRERIGYED